MTNYEKLLDEAEKECIFVDERHAFLSPRIKGLYCDGSIALSRELTTNSQKACIFAEELGHFYTTCGDILDQTDISSRKQEYRARLWSFNKMIGLTGIVEAFCHGCRDMGEMAEYLDVTEEFLAEAIQCYRSKYGVCKRLENHVIYFDPLGVLKLCR